MRMFLTLSLLCVAAFGFTACNQHYNHPGHPHANGDFCPPGQAKKGNC